MIFAKRYENLIFHGEKHEIWDDICGNVDYNLRVTLVNTMTIFSEPMTFYPNRYDSNDIIKTNAFEYACNKFNNIMGIPYIQFGFNYNLDNTLADLSLS
ncbi:MAG: hypothetical protein K2O29_09990, partial [Ruminococcus sp.]|nr:hypothetical protein [Ruminococcus sp.]